MFPLPSARTVLTIEAVARSVWLSGRKVLGANLNCSESCLGIRWWEIAALRDFDPVNVGCGSKTSKAQNEQMLSGLPSIADMRDAVADFRLVPPSDQVHRSKIVLFDHLVGNCEQLVWYREAEGLGRLEIDNEQEFSRLFHWEIGRLCAF